MFRNNFFVSLLASSALTLAAASPALAGATDRAREAIAAAEAKLHTADTLGAATDSPRETAQAQALLASAKEDFKSDRREVAIQEAIQASALADTALGMAQKHKDEALASARAEQHDTVDAARDQIAAAQGRAAAAQDQTVAAQQQAADAKQQAADANARASAAQQSAAASAADANAARNAAVAAQATPSQVQTTVTTQQAANTRHPVRRKVVRSTTTTAAPASTTSSEQVTTTTQVTPQQ